MAETLAGADTGAAAGAGAGRGSGLEMRVGKETGTRPTPTLPSFSLAGRVTVVTGGAQGLGLVMARAIVLSGSSVAIVDLNEELAAKEALGIVEDFKKAYPGATTIPKVTAHHTDVSSPTLVTATIASILASHGKIDSLVTSAGFVQNFPAVDYPIENFRKLMAVNVEGTYLFAVAVAKHLMGRGSGGSMAFIGSMSGSVVNVPQMQTPYNISKAAVRHLAASLAVEWAKDGIRVNCISPGYMITALTKDIIEKDPELYEIRWLAV